MAFTMSTNTEDMTYVRLVTVVFLSSMICHVIAQSVDKGPKDVLAFEGENVTFVCDLRNVNGYTVHWYIHLKYLSINIVTRQIYTEIPAYLQGRVSITGDEKKEQFNLHIGNVKTSDGGKYDCLFGPPDVTPTEAGTANLVILIPPSQESPVCEVATSVDWPIDIGHLVDLGCYVLGETGNPIPNVTIYKKSELLAGPLKSSIYHSHRLTEEDNGVTFTCTMTTPSLAEPRNCSFMPLRILPNATIQPPSATVEEGFRVTFKCYGTGVPRIASYAWTVLDTDTGETVPSQEYTVKKNGEILKMVVRGNTELLCTVRVPSGLSGNASAAIQVEKREVTTELPGRPTSRSNRPTAEPFTSPVVLIVAVIGVLVLIVVAVSVLLLCRARRKRRPNVIIDPAEKFKMSETRPAAKPQQWNTRAKAADETVVHMPLPASSLRPTPGVNQDHDQNHYSTVAGDADPVEADSGLVYADLDMTSSVTTGAAVGKPDPSSQTVYAAIRTQ